MNYDFYKYQALGNDYIIVDPKKVTIDMSTSNIQLICHRNYGIGSDGILYGPIYKGNDVYLKIFNPDGSEAEKSGNGIRIFSRYLFDAGYLKENDFDLFTLGGKVHVTFLDDKASKIQVDMGCVTFSSSKIPMNGKPREVVNENLNIKGKNFKITCLSIGNPHCVVPVKRVSREMAEEFGPVIEKHPLFPKRINVQLLEIIDRNNIKIEIWERGAGYTLASGSSSCAAASVAYKLGLVENVINVNMPGGKIGININENGRVLMTGTVDAVFKGNFSSSLLEKLEL